MPEIRALIVDDEPLARRGVRQLLAPFTDIVVVGECRDGFEAVRALTTTAPDLIFLDVQMPGLDGLGVVRLHGPERMPVTVFVTAHDEFAVRAFEANALDYLVKPLSEARFRATIARVRERFRVRDAVAMADRLAALLLEDRSYAAGHADLGTAARPAGPRIAVPTESGQRLLAPGEIDWIEARDDVVAIHAGEVEYVVRNSLAGFERALDPGKFVRIHRSAIVQLDRVAEWKSGGATPEVSVVLDDGTELPVSRRRAARVKALLRPPSRG